MTKSSHEHNWALAFNSIHQGTVYEKTYCCDCGESKKEVLNQELADKMSKIQGDLTGEGTFTVTGLGSKDYGIK